MKAFIKLFLLSLMGVLTPLHAQWQWVDESGRKVFSDRPPPQHIAADKVLQKPKSSTATTPSQASPPAAPPGTAPAPATASSQGKSPAQQPTPAASHPPDTGNQIEAPAAASAQDCQNARTNKAALESGRMVSVLNSKGERELMSDQARQQEISYLQEILASSCPP